MNFLTWYGIGIATIVITLFIEALTYSPKGHRIRQAFYELYSIFCKQTDLVSNVIVVATVVVVALLGPILLVIFAYLIARNWYDSLPIDDEDKKVYPWSSD